MTTIPSPGKAENRLKAALEKCGAMVTAITLTAGHEMTAEDIALASEWIAVDSDCKTPAECNMAV